MANKHYEVAVVGGSISGTALFYALSRYTDIKKIALVEKYSAPSLLNSNAASNSQTIHSGDIETNYTYEKAKDVKVSADMLVNYAVKNGLINNSVFEMQKMVLGVGDEEVESIKQRFEKFVTLYPYLELFDKETLRSIEPNVVLDKNGNDRKENIVAMGTKGGVYTTADFGAMSVSFIENAKKEDKICDLYLNNEVLEIEKVGDRFFIKTNQNLTISADFIVVNAGAHSLYLAHKMGHGKDLACLAIAGSFYFAKKDVLKGKVYMVQNPKLPFAALHGDPDINYSFQTRFGPTALPLLKLERYRGLKSFPEYLKTLNLDTITIGVLLGLLKDKDIRNYVGRNILFEVPYINKRLFVKDARKIVPSLKVEDIYYAKGFGGVRPQVIDKTNKVLKLGEASIDTKEGIIFNMTPSPGATSSLRNALNDARKACEFLGKEFNEEKSTLELM
ncbi:MAG: FAD-dependent oxidoreductase [Campylobacteraceae bacterium]|nr:FAD-dependent oxidoreductase [Campylobacteraceae bacterium]